MDYKFIILAIVGIIIAYIIYIYVYSTPGTNLSKNTIYLGGSNNPNITFTTLTSKIFISTTPSYYAWVYVNTSPSNNINTFNTGTNGTKFTDLIPSTTGTSVAIVKTLFYLNGIAGTSAQPTVGSHGYYAWALDKTGHNLYVVYNTSQAKAADAAFDNNNIQTTNCVQVLNNLPLQSWVFIAVVLDTTVSPNIMDVYMNGKLTNSIILDSGATYQPPIPPSGVSSSSATSTVTGGLIGKLPSVQAITWGSGQDIYISNLTGFATPLSPDDVQKAYLSFAGSDISISNASTHVGISATKGSGKNISANDFKIW